MSIVHVHVCVKFQESNCIEMMKISYTCTCIRVHIYTCTCTLCSGIIAFNMEFQSDNLEQLKCQ